jgi:antitoxin component YwqK of YwqJK toxin-antitoxin module
MKLIILYLAFFNFFLFQLNAQGTLEEYTPINNFTLNFDDYYINFHFLTTKKPNIEINDNLYYYWFKTDQIHSTQGAIGGQALHGDFIVFYDDRNLKEKGVFNMGLKDGKWKKWHNNGVLMEVGTWDKGRKEDSWFEYDPEGLIVKEANYNHGALDGNYKEYFNGELVIEKKYKNGKEIIRKEKQLEKDSIPDRKEKKK